MQEIANQMTIHRNRSLLIVFLIEDIIKIEKQHDIQNLIAVDILNKSVLFCFVQWSNEVLSPTNNQFNKIFDIKYVEVIFKEKHVEVCRGI